MLLQYDLVSYHLEKYDDDDYDVQHKDCIEIRDRLVKTILKNTSVATAVKFIKYLHAKAIKGEKTTELF